MIGVKICARKEVERGGRARAGGDAMSCGWCFLLVTVMDLAGRSWDVDAPMVVVMRRGKVLTVLVDTEENC